MQPAPDPAVQPADRINVGGRVSRNALLARIFDENEQVAVLAITQSKRRTPPAQDNSTRMVMTRVSVKNLKSYMASFLRMPSWRLLLTACGMWGAVR
jgi:hypothetical protein